MTGPQAASGAIPAIKARFFRFWIAYQILLAMLSIVSNLLIGLDFSFNYKWIASILTGGVLLYLAARELWLPVVHRIGVYLGTVILIPLAWLTSAGLDSPAMGWSLLGFLVINYMLVGWERLLANLGYLLVLMCLVVLQWQQPGLFADYTPREQALDWLFNLPLIVFFLAAVLIHFERAYERERQLNQQQTRALSRLAETDVLTGLLNRQQLDRALQQALAHYRRSGSPSALLFVDIDAFKAYNDALGHTQGDACLVRVADCLRAALRREHLDAAYRFGGEEFLMLLPETDVDGARVVAERVQAQLRLAALPHPASVSDRVTVSIGVAVLDEGIRTIDGWLNRADTALYEAKTAGRDCVRVAGSATAPPAAQRG